MGPEAILFKGTFYVLKSGSLFSYAFWSCTIHM